MPFGLPERAPDPQPIIDTLTDNLGQLQIVITALTDSMGKHLTDAETLNGMVATTASKSLASRVRGNNTQLNELVGQLQAALTSAWSTSQSQIDTIANSDEANPNGPPIVPPQGPSAPGTTPPLPANNPDSAPLPPDDAPNPWQVETESIAGADQSLEQTTATLIAEPEEEAIDDADATEAPPWPNPPFSADLCARAGGPLKQGFPFPGSQEFCDQVEEIKQYLADVGTEILGFLGNPGGAVALEQWIRTGMSDSDPDLDKTEGIMGRLRLLTPQVQAYKASVYAFRNALISGLAFLVKKSADAVAWIYRGIQTVWEWYRCLTQKFSPPALLGTTLARCVLESLKKFRFGADPGIWATLDIAIHVPVLERIIGMMDNYIAPLEVPGPGEAIEAYVRGEMSEGLRDCILLLNGCNPDVFKPIIASRSARLSPPEAMQYSRRIGANDEATNKLLGKAGLSDEGQREAYKYLYDEIPTITDHLLWLRKNVYNEDYVAQYGLEDGFEERFWAKFGDDLRALGMKKETARLHYAAHWIMPSPEQMREFVYRLPIGEAEAGKHFTVEDYGNILAEQDYSPLAVEWFKQTVYRVPALGYLRDMYRQGIIDDAQLAKYHRNLGYSEEDSLRFVNIDRIQKDRMRATQAHGWNPAAIARSVGSGLMTDQKAIALMGELGYPATTATDMIEVAKANIQSQVLTRARSRLLSSTVTAVRQALDVGIMSVNQASGALQAAGWPQDKADGIAQLESTTGGIKRIKQAISYIKRSVLSGEITMDTAGRKLQSLGIQPGEVVNYQTLWALMFTPGRKRRSASQVVSDLSLGSISTIDALARLVNLGYSDADSRLYLAEAQRKVIDRQTKAQAAQDKTAKQAAKELEALHKQAVAQQKALLAELQKQSPVKTMQAWAKLGLLGKDVFMARMKLYGYDDNDALRYYEEACKAKGSACSDTTPGYSAPPQGSDTTSAGGKPATGGA